MIQQYGPQSTGSLEARKKKIERAIAWNQKRIMSSLERIEKLESELNDVIAEENRAREKDNG